MAQTDVSVTEFKGNATNLVKAVKQIDTATKNLDASLVSVLAHLDAIEKGLKNVNSITNNAKSITNTITAKNNTNTFDFGTQKKIVKGSAGFMGSDTGQEKAFKDYQQAVITETQEITKDIAERRRRRKQRADAETTAANASALRASKMEDQTSARYLDRMDKLAEARMLNAKNNQAGSYLRNPRYQTGKAFSAIGGVVSGWGTGGKMAGLFLDSLGALVKAPVAGAATAVSNLVKGISDLGTEAVKAYTEIESIKTQLGIVFSSQTQANAAFGEISEYAVHSPFGIQQTSELAVLLKQSGVYASDLMDTLRMLGDTAGGNMEKMKRIANNYAQIVSIGKASMLDMRQFAYAGIPIFEAVSEELKVSQSELRKMISDGKVTSDIIEKVFKNLTGINGIFENATEVGAKTLKARLQNLADAKQLAMASIGEWITSSGTQTGNDSYANRMVSFAEDIYSWIKEHVNTVNLENSVKVIERRNDRITQLQQLIEYNKGNKETLKYLQNALERELSKRDAEKERATYSASYDDKVAQFQEIFEAVGTIDLRTAKNKLYNLQDWYSTDVFSRNYLKDDARYKEFSMLDNESILIAIDELKDYIHLIKTLNQVTKEEIKAHRESLLLDAQQLAYDQALKRSDATGSLNSSFQELLSIYRESDEYKEKEEEKKQKTLEEAKEILKKIAVNTDQSGRVDITGFGLGDLYSYVQSGAFTPGRKLNVVTDKSTSMKEQDKSLLIEQVGYIAKKVMSSYEGLGATKYLKDAFGDAAIASLRKLDVDEFFDQFSVYYKKMEDALNSLADNTKNFNDKQKIAINKQTEIFTTLLPLMLSTLEAETGGIDADTTNKNKTGQEFIPLWKRILAGATGLSAEGITDTAQTLGNYRNDMSVRKIASSVMTEAIKTMSVSAAMKLAKASNTVAQLTGAPAQTVQIDWKATRDAVRNFATQLSASTSVINAYKNALEDEYNTFVSLVAAGYTTAESQDLKNQKYVSGEKYSRLIASAGSQLVNAFGEKLRTDAGKDVWLQSNGKFYDVSSLEGLTEEQQKSHEVQVDNLIVTENLFEIIKQTLPTIETELHEANTIALKNTKLEELLKEIKGTQLLKRLADYSSPLSGQVTSFFTDNPDTLVSAYDSAIKTVLNQYKDENGDYLANYKWLEGLSDADLLMADITGKGGEYTEQIAYIIKKALEKVNAEWEPFVTNGYINGQRHQSTYASANDIRNRKDIDDAVNRKLQRALGLDSKPLTTDRYAGWRGDRNFLLKALGFDMTFDREDLLAGAVRSGAAEAWGITSVTKGQAKFVEDDSELVKQLKFADKLTILLNTHMEDVKETIDEMASSMIGATKEFSQQAFLAPFEKWGEYLAIDTDYMKELGVSMKNITADLVASLGSYAAKAGLSLIAMGAEMLNPGLVAAGITLAAAGGFATGFGNAMKDDSGKKDRDDNTKKLESLKNDLTKLLEQARTDALYYENNLRHKSALGMNRGFSYKSVHDAIITPKGVVETDPKDYLIATKTPGQFAGGAVVVQPIINSNIVNNTNSRVRQEQQQNSDGSIDIITIIEEATGNFIASSKSDSAFEAREYRMRGKSVVM